MSRRELAIRDFFDLDHAVRELQLVASDPALIELVRRKLSVPGNDAIDVGPERLEQLRDQLDARLRPVLRPSDFAAFDLDRAFQIVRSLAEAVVRG